MAVIHAVETRLKRYDAGEPVDRDSECTLVCSWGGSRGTFALLLQGGVAAIARRSTLFFKIEILSVPVWYEYTPTTILILKINRSAAGLDLRTRVGPI